MPRIVWKGAISFGLVHVPVVVYPGARAGRLDFDWLDKRDMAPVGYQRINKRTGNPIDNDFIVKGYQYEKGEYVLMSDEDFRQANDVATQTVEILAFVDAAEVPIFYFDTPYYLEPDRRGDKGYRLLREVLRSSGRIGIAHVVLHTRQHLAALLPVGDTLVLNTMRHAEEIVSMEELRLPEGSTGKDGPSAREYEMAERLVDDMTTQWEPGQYRNSYREDLLERIEAKIQAGHTHELTEPGRDAPVRESAKVIDLMALLKQSLDRRGGRPSPPSGEGDGAPGRTPTARAGSGARKVAAGAAARRTSAKSTVVKTAGKAGGRSSATRGEKSAGKVPGKTAASVGKDDPARRAGPTRNGSATRRRAA